MSTPQNRLTPAPVRQDAICMCATGGACSSFAPSHAVHLIQARLVSATPTEWVDAIVTHADADGTVVVASLDGTSSSCGTAPGLRRSSRPTHRSRTTAATTC